MLKKGLLGGAGLVCALMALCIGFVPNGGGVTPEEFGAIGDGLSDDTRALQRAVDSQATVILERKYLIAGCFRVTKPVHVVWRGGEVIQSNFNGAGFIISGKGVKFSGLARVYNTGRPSILKSALCGKSGDVKQWVSGVVLVGGEGEDDGASNFVFDEIHARGYVNGMSIVGSNLGHRSLSNVKGKRLECTECDFAVFGAGFSGLTVGHVVAHDFRETQGVAGHVIYTTGSKVGRSEGLRVSVVDATRSGLSRHALLIKGSQNFEIGTLLLRHGQPAMSVQWSQGRVNHVLWQNGGVTIPNYHDVRSDLTISEGSEVHVGHIEGMENLRRRIEVNGNSRLSYERLDCGPEQKCGMRIEEGSSVIGHKLGVDR